MFTVEEMLKLSIFDGASVLAGENGLSRKVKFIDFIEVPDAYRWLSKETFKFTTGYAFRETPGMLTELIRAYIGGNVSGFGIKLGRFIDSLPQEIYVMANAADFPLISLPESLPYAVIAKTVMREIFRCEQEYPFKGSDINEELFLIDRDPDGITEILEKQGWGRERKVWALQFSNSFFNIPALSSREYVLNFKEKTRVLAHAVKGETPHQFLEMLRADNNGLFDGTIVSLYGPTTVEKLPIAFKKTTEVQSVAAALGHSRGFFTYCQLELLTLIYRFADKKTILTCAQKVLQPLLDEDATGHMELVRTLSVWLACGRSVSAAAEELYIHRNTLRYRLNKIEELTSLAEDNLFILRTALMLYCAPCTTTDYSSVL